MTTGARLAVGLSTSEGLSGEIRRRIDFTFRVFCAVYGFEPVSGEEAAVTLCYGCPASGPREVAVTAGYRARPLHEPLPAPELVDVTGAAGRRVRFPVFHGDAEAGPDWLGEAFEWLSAAHERAAPGLDAVGRVPYGATLPGSFDLDPEEPYASIAFHHLNQAIRRKIGTFWPEDPGSLLENRRCVLFSSIHDLDFLHVSPAQTLYRLAKNTALAAVLHRSPRGVADILRRAASDVARGRTPLDYMEDVVKLERERGIRSTYAIICARRHRRDANYSLFDERVRRRLRALRASGIELAVHGSYRSLEEAGQLKREYVALAELAEAAPAGGRQHWLRYRGAELFEALEECGAQYDASVGFSARPGFRAGAAFPYPPYNFREERPFRFLELPLVIMDGALSSFARNPAACAAVARRIMDAVRGYGWGGASLLWHDSVLSGCQLPKAVADLYWELRGDDDLWVGGAELVHALWPRYARCGLLPPLRDELKPRATFVRPLAGQIAGIR